MSPRCFIITDITSMAFSPDTSVLAFGSKDGTINIMAVETTPRGNAPVAAAVTCVSLEMACAALLAVKTEMSISVMSAQDQKTFRCSWCSELYIESRPQHSLIMVETELRVWDTGSLNYQTVSREFLEGTLRFRCSVLNLLDEENLLQASDMLDRTINDRLELRIFNIASNTTLWKRKIGTEVGTVDTWNNHGVT